MTRKHERYHQQNRVSGQFILGIIAACAIFLALPAAGMAGELPPYSTSVDLATYTFDATNGTPTGVSANINAGTFDLRDWTAEDGYSSYTHSVYVKASGDTPAAINPTGNAYHSVTFTVQGLGTNETLSLTSLRFGSYGTYRDAATTFIHGLYSSLTGVDSTNSELARVSFTTPKSATTAYTDEITTVADLTAANPVAGTAFTGLTNGASVTFRFYYADDSNAPTRDVHRLDNIVLSGVLDSGTVITSVVATASSERDATFPASNAIDGVISDASRWMNVQTDNPAWLRLDFPEERLIRGITLYSGYGDTGSAVQGFVVECVKNGNWVEIPSSRVIGNLSQELVLPFDEDVTTPAIRIVFSDVGYVRVREVTVWDQTPVVPAPDGDQTLYLNQSGYSPDVPKRFTMPNRTNGTPFTVENKATGEVLYRGTIQNEIGDFSAVTQCGTNDYVVKVDGRSSDPFRIAPWWLERVTSQLSIDFMNASRHRTGNVTNLTVGSYGWRDDHHFAFSLSTLVDQYISNPAVYERMPSKITYSSPQDGLWGALDPWDESAPDIVKLIHWGADVVVTQGLTHEFMKGELASFLYAWPLLKQWLPQQNYDVVKAFAKEHWGDATADRGYPYDTSPEHNLFVVKTTIGTTKGENPPGHSVLPNLLMWQTLLRDGDATATLYRDAARAQVAWMVENLDWTDPQTTKGQRMSENITMHGLAAFARLDPEGKPEGFDAFLQQWADVAISRSGNLWDFRRLNDTDWVPYDPDVLTKWNEPGNVAGFPAAALEAEQLISDPAEKEELLILAQSHIDDMFGRNPTGRHFSYDAPNEIEGVERGWYSFNPGGIGALRDVPFVLDGAPKNDHYPYEPTVGNVGWTEGWIEFNTAYNRTLAARAFHATQIRMMQRSDRVDVTLRAPLNFDYTTNEPVHVEVVSSGGDQETVTLTEESPFAEQDTGSIPLQIGGTPTPGNGILEVAAGDEIQTGYGFGYLGHTAAITVTTNVISTYSEWQSSIQWRGESGAPLDSVGSSGLNNMQVYLFGLGSPFDAQPYQPGFVVSPDALSAWFAYRKNLLAEDIGIMIEVSTNLQSWAEVTILPGDLKRRELSKDVEEITLRLPTNERDQMFIRLTASLNNP